MKGIQSIALEPGSHGGEVATALGKALDSATSLRAAVAYWCVGPKQFGPSLAKRLSGDGFLCVDVHLPTDIDILARMVSAGSNVYLYLKNPNPQPGELRMHFPPHLMHPKMLLFDYDAEPAELWVGSHNWTARALTGVNIEASLRLRLEKHASLYVEAVTFLDSVRAKCIPFDLGAVDYYKWLQGAALEEPMWVMELSGVHSVLEAHKKLTVFGRSDDDYKNLKSVDKNIVISLQDPNTGQESLYEATVVNTGYLSDSGFTFDSRLYAVQDGAPRPLVSGPAIPPPTIRGTAKSWATMSLIEALVGATFELPPAERWVPEETEKQSWLPDLKHWFPKPEKPLVQRAVPKATFERGLAATTPAVPMRALVTHAVTSETFAPPPQLLRKKIVRAKRGDGEAFIIGKPKRFKEKDEE